VSARLAALTGGRPGGGWVIPYLTAGYPEPAETVDLLLALQEGGADALELGLPFSDPLADGPVIQKTSQAALERGIDHRRILEIAAAFRSRSSLPLILMGYVNPVLAYGPGRFFADAASAGVDGLLLADLPPEESAPFHEPARRAGLSWVFLAAPTSSDARLARIDALSDDLVYCVSVTGITGERDRLPDGLRAYLARAATTLTKPFVVGFGFSRPDQVREAVPPAAGVVVGSALLRALGEEAGREARLSRAEAFVREFRAGA
jgi:tryptophan synthase alpha chain